MGMLDILSHAVLERHLGSEGRLDNEEEEEYTKDSDEDERTEDSDYENEPELTDKQVSRNVEIGSEHEGEQKLLSTLSIGSSAA